jgi:hypothetical protein
MNEKMLVFISWSEERSKYIAKTLSEWFESVFHNVRSWVSTEDIAAGKRWNREVTKALDEAKFGVSCVTPENKVAPWLLFEAGAIAKSVTDAYMCPYLFDLKTTELVGPLSQFQMTPADREGTLKLVKSMNQALGENGLTESKLLVTFDKWWPDLESALKNVPSLRTPTRATRDEKSMIEEILETVRKLDRTIPTALRDIDALWPFLDERIEAGEDFRNHLAEVFNRRFLGPTGGRLRRTPLPLEQAAKDKETTDKKDAGGNDKEKQK